MSLDLLLVTDLILVKAEVVFKLAEGFFNAPAKQVSEDGRFYRHGEIISDEHMNVFIIRISPFIKDEEYLQRGRAVFESRLHGEG